MKNKLIVLSGSALVFAVPMLAFAQDIGTFIGCQAQREGTIEGILCKVGQILNLAIPIVITLGILYFIWGIISFVIANDEEAKKRGRDRIIYGVIGLAVIVAVWGLVYLLLDTFGIKDNADINNVTFPTVEF